MATLQNLRNLQVANGSVQNVMGYENEEREGLGGGGIALENLVI